MSYTNPESAIDWPAGWERTPPAERERTYKYDAGIGQTTSELVTELERLDVDDWSVSFGNQHRKSNGMPRYNANPDDPGFVLRWSKDGRSHAVACDHYTDLAANLRTVYLWFRETRLRGDRPVRTGRSNFAAAELPGGEAVEAPATAAHTVLGVGPDASEAEIREAYREQMMNAHPDHGGDADHFIRVREAAAELLEGDV